jgi:hypothetical protein
MRGAGGLALGCVASLSSLDAPPTHPPGCILTLFPPSSPPPQPQPQPPAFNCSDSSQNGNETDVDCGGDACSPCSNGAKCLVSADCVSGSVCSSNKICEVVSFLT